MGAVTDTTAKVWARTCEPADIAVEYRPAGDDGWDDAALTAPVPTRAETDNTAAVSIDGLEPSTAYEYRLLVDGERAAEGRFRTLVPPGQPSKLSFIVGSDMHHPYEPLPVDIVEAMGDVDADFGLFLGDQFVIEIVVTQVIGRFVARSVDDYRLGYRDAWAFEPWQAFMATTPTLLTWDDHEIWNDWGDGDAEPYPWARQAFDEYAEAANPEPLSERGVQFIVRAGEVEVFVLDTRSYRSPGLMPDGPDKTMLGDEQKAQLKEWLSTSEARFKLIASSVMWSEFSGHKVGGESWPAFLTERNEIFDFIRDNNISGVVLLSGDEHWAGIIRIDPWGLHEIAPAPLNWVQRVGNRQGPDLLYSLGLTPVFGYFTADTTVCPATLTVEIKDHERTRFTLPLTETDLGGDPARCG